MIGQPESSKMYEHHWRYKNNIENVTTLGAAIRKYEEHCQQRKIIQILPVGHRANITCNQQPYYELLGKTKRKIQNVKATQGLLSCAGLGSTSPVYQRKVWSGDTGSDWWPPETFRAGNGFTVGLWRPLWIGIRTAESCPLIAEALVHAKISNANLENLLSIFCLQYRGHPRQWKYWEQWIALYWNKYRQFCWITWKQSCFALGRK